MRPRKWQDDPLTPVRGVRLRAALELRGLTVSEAARRTGVSQPRLHQLVSGNTRCRASVLLRLARLVRVSDAWLSGHLVGLPGARVSEQHLLSNARSTLWRVCNGLEDLLKLIRRGKRVSSRSAELRELGSSCRALYAVFDWKQAELPRRVREPSAPVRAIREHIGAVLPLLEAPGRHRLALSKHLRALRRVEQELPYYWTEQPARAELAEHSLRAACHHVWREQAQRDHPGFDPRAEIMYDEQTGSPPDPWPNMFAMDRIIEAALTPEVWRALLMKDWRDGRMPSPNPEEAEEMIIALARALRLVLEPWFDGLARLDVEGLSSSVPHLWARTLTARGADESADGHERILI
jgi:transcriptional regulator with XRE-family HTH domain